MTISLAFRKAYSVYFGHFGASMKFLTVELCLTLMALAPLLFLTNGSLTLLALLSVPLFLLLMLPARVNAARAMQDAMEGGPLFSLELADGADYGRKLGSGLKRCLYLLLWGGPLIAGLIIARAHISGDMDGFTLLRMIKAFGGDDLMRGVIYLGIILVAMLVLLAVGIGFHSGDRHAWVLDRPEVLKGKRGRVLGCWVCSLVILLPLLIALIVLAVRYLPVLADLNGLLLGTLELPDTKVSLIIFGVGALLTVPLLPLRSLVTAAYINGWAHQMGLQDEDEA